VDEGTGTRIGAAVRSARLRRGLSLDVVAGLAGHSKSWLSKVERGLLPLERRSDLAALADALQVSVVDLTGQPYDETREAAAAAAVPRLRRALLDTPDPTLASDPDELVSATEALAELRFRLDLAALGERLPGLIDRLRGTVATASARDRPRLLRALFVATHAASATVRNLGYLDLATIAADQVMHTAAELGDPVWIAASGFSRGHAVLPSGAFRAAYATTSAAADAATALPGADARGAAGALLLVSAVAAAAGGRAADAQSRLDAADELAAGDAGRTFTTQFSFGPANVAVHRVSVALESGRPANAVAVADRIDIGEIPTPERRAAYWADLGRAWAQLGDDEHAVAALRRGEAEAPARVRLNPFVREAVADMVDRAHRAAVGRELRGLAYRMGLPH